MWWLSSNETPKEHCSAECLLWQKTALHQCLKWVLAQLAQDRKHQWSTAKGLPTETIQAILNFPCQAKCIAEVSHSTKTELNEVLQNLPFAVELCFNISVFTGKKKKIQPSSTHYVCKVYSKPLKKVWPILHSRSKKCEGPTQIPTAFKRKLRVPRGHSVDPLPEVYKGFFRGRWQDVLMLKVHGDCVSIP